MLVLRGRDRNEKIPIRHPSGFILQALLDFLCIRHSTKLGGHALGRLVGDDDHLVQRRCGRKDFGGGGCGAGP